MANYTQKKTGTRGIYRRYRDGKPISHAVVYRVDGKQHVKVFRGSATYQEAVDFKNELAVSKAKGSLVSPDRGKQTVRDAVTEYLWS